MGCTKACKPTVTVADFWGALIYLTFENTNKRNTSQISKLNYFLSWKEWKNTDLSKAKISSCTSLFRSYYYFIYTQNLWLFRCEQFKIIMKMTAAAKFDSATCLSPKFKGWYQFCLPHGPVLSNKAGKMLCSFLKHRKKPYMQIWKSRRRHADKD